MRTAFFCWGVGAGGGGGVEPPTKFSKGGGGLIKLQLWEGVVGKEGVTFFRGDGGGWVAISQKKQTKISNI